MRSYPCVVGLLDEACLDYVAKHIREGDALALRREPSRAQAANPVACFHGERLIGHVPQRQEWLADAIEKAASHRVTVAGFDIDSLGRLAYVEVDVAVEGGEASEASARSIISEIGDELRILAMVGAADGHLEATERIVMERFAEMRAGEMGIVPGEGEAAHAVRWARRHAANVLDVASIVNRLARQRPEALDIIWEACMTVAEIDGEIAIEERQTMTTLRSLLQTTAARKSR
jgi:tellurite resistance protein